MFRPGNTLKGKNMHRYLFVCVFVANKLMSIFIIACMIYLVLDSFFSAWGVGVSYSSSVALLCMGFVRLSQSDPLENLRPSKVEVKSSACAITNRNWEFGCEEET